MSVVSSPKEFPRRHGSTSRLCRKVRSADNLPLASSASRHHNEVRNLNDDLGEDERHEDQENFIKNTRDSRDQKNNGRDDEVNFYAQINHDNIITKDADIALQEIPYQQQNMR